jgi:hypothetical protein
MHIPCIDLSLSSFLPLLVAWVQWRGKKSHSHRAELERTSTQLIYFDFITSGCSVQRCQGSHGAGTHHHHLLPGSRGGHDRQSE